MQKIKDFWWIFIEMGVPLKELRRLVSNKIYQEKYAIKLQEQSLYNKLIK